MLNRVTTPNYVPAAKITTTRRRRDHSFAAWRFGFSVPAYGADGLGIAR